MIDFSFVQNKNYDLNEDDLIALMFGLALASVRYGVNVDNPFMEAKSKFDRLNSVFHFDNYDLN